MLKERFLIHRLIDVPNLVQMLFMSFKITLCFCLCLLLKSDIRGFRINQLLNFWFSYLLMMNALLLTVFDCFLQPFFTLFLDFSQLFILFFLQSLLFFSFFLEPLLQLFLLLALHPLQFRSLLPHLANKFWCLTLLFLVLFCCLFFDHFSKCLDLNLLVH